MKALAYTRVSTQEQANTGVSLDSQEERVRLYCQLAGLDLAGLVAEQGVSGTIALTDRPGGGRLLALVKKHKARHVVALKLDRLFRSAVDALQQTKAWDDAGIALHLVDMGGQSINTASAMGRMMLTMLAAFAEFERNLTAERTRDALQHKRAHRQVYNHDPYGFRRKGDELVDVPDELAVVARIRAWREELRTLRAIAGLLNEEKVPTKIAGGKWHASTVANVLRLAKAA